MASRFEKYVLCDFYCHRFRAITRFNDVALFIAHKDKSKTSERWVSIYISIYIPSFELYTEVAEMQSSLQKRLSAEAKARMMPVPRKKEPKARGAGPQTNLLEKNGQESELKDAVMKIVSGLVKYRDNITAEHASRTQEYVKFMIEESLEERIYVREISSWDLELLLPSVQLHDLGKIAISDTILNKPGKLTCEEFDKMKEHVIIGVEMLERIEKVTAERHFLHHAKIFAATHHEKWDGSGYPWGLSGEGIPLEGRMMAIADVYDALTSERPYKDSYSAEEAEEIIESGRGTHFEPTLVDIFHKAAKRFEEAVNRNRLAENLNKYAALRSIDYKSLAFIPQYAAVALQ
jgi:response regulator RpfG family c-di-GMP phosphodiesterase